MAPLLETHQLCKRFGGLKAVQGIDLAVEAGRIVSVIGPNGAGKTTLFNCLSGIYRAESGTILLDGTEILGRPPHEVCRRGLARTFQNIRLFPEMTVLENVIVGQFSYQSFAPLGLLFHSAAYRQESARFRAEAESLLEFVGLAGLGPKPSKSLAYGLQRRLEIARALATRPRLLLLDEPAAGMNPQETQEMIELIARVRDRGHAVLLIEHHMKLVMTISDEILVLDHGVPIAHGAPAAVRADPAVIQAYLGAEID